MLAFNTAFQEADYKFSRIFGESIPTRMLPPGLTNEQVYALVDESIEVGRNLFHEMIRKDIQEEKLRKG